MSSNGIIWLASYPKSGNTWLRTFLTSILLKGKDFTLNRLVGDPILSGRRILDSYLGFDSIVLRDEEVLRLVPKFLSTIAKDPTKNYISKTHSIFTLNDDGIEYVPKSCIKKVIYLVRNPFDVSISYKFHEGFDSVDPILEFMNCRNAFISKPNGKFSFLLPQQIGSWSQNYWSWKKGVPNDLILICRYEDLLQEPKKWFKRILDFLEMEYDENSLQKAIEETKLSKLKSKENKSGFFEKNIKSKTFFRTGKIGEGRHELTQDQIKSLIENHKSALLDLAYIDDLGNILI